MNNKKIVKSLVFSVILVLTMFLITPIIGYAGTYIGLNDSQIPQNQASQVFTPKLIVTQLGVKQLKFSGRLGNINYCEKYINKASKSKPSLVVVLHDKTGIGDDNVRQLYSPVVKSLINYAERTNTKTLVLLPQCPSYSTWIRANDGSSPYKAVFELVNQKIRENNIPIDRVYVVGLSMGGNATYHMMMKYPRLFSKTVIISSGGNIQDIRFLSGNFYIIHGSDDDIIPVNKIENIVDVLKENPSNSVKYEVLPEKSHHECISCACTDKLWKWLFN